MQLKKSVRSPSNKAKPPPTVRLKIAVRGAVQGVGFRPFIFRLATELQLAGWVNNSPQGVFIEVEGPRRALEQLLLRLETENPPRSFIQSLEASWLDKVGFKQFEIRPSDTGGDKTALVLPDIATCTDCLREILDPANRRHHYPFTNCTNCGPRFSIIESLPYDRANTSMKGFTMCPQCQAEYDDPRDRRFHAQPNACPVCGPHLELWRGSVRENTAEKTPHSHECSHVALLAAVRAIREGKTVAVKGLGGFHLLVAAHNDHAVKCLRERKQREEKPFALMFPSLESVKAECEVSPLEERLLRSPEAPIVLLRRLVRPHPGPLASVFASLRRDRAEAEGEGGQERENPPPSVRESVTAAGSSIEAEKIANRKSQIANPVAPGNPNLGVMLPYTPLHHLLLAELGFPVIATSGNLSDEPICTDEHEALERLRGIADVFLVHNRPIVRHVDDSIVRVMLNRELVLRRARGFAPLPITLNPQPSNPNPPPILAVGAHLKNAIALSIGNQVFISQHIGDLETEPAYLAFHRVIADFERLYDVRPQTIVADLHPDYLSTRFALERRSPTRRESSGQQAGSETGAPGVMQVQHHIAHILSCMAENEIEPPVLGISWDGTGYGTDGTIWGGEFFLVTNDSVERVAHLRPFRLPGGGQAVKEPRRTALGLLYEVFGDTIFGRKDLAPITAFSAMELAALKTMLVKNLNSPLTSSAGRLFDAVASLINLRQQIRFEGHAAMELEFALDGIKTEAAYSLPIAPVLRGRLPIEYTRRTTGTASRITPHASRVLDWSPMVEAMLVDVKNNIPTATLSAKFHNALAEAMVRVAKHCGQNRVVLSGGCFQNRYLTERAIQRLQAEGFRPYWHQRVPPNDGGIALGQVIAARRTKG